MRVCFDSLISKLFHVYIHYAMLGIIVQIRANYILYFFFKATEYAGEWCVNYLSE